jgi:hypothetical protein
MKRSEVDAVISDAGERQPQLVRRAHELLIHEASSCVISVLDKRHCELTECQQRLPLLIG